MLRKASSLLLGLLPLLLSCAETGSGSLGPIEGDTAFAIVSRSPGPGRSGVDVNTWITVAFSSPVDPSTARNGSITVNGGLAGRVEVNGNTVQFVPAGRLEPGTSYAISVSATLKGSNGLLLGPTPAWGFKTAGALPPPPDTTNQFGPRPGDAGFGLR